MRRWIAAIAAVLALSNTALADTFTVTGTADSGVGSLRWAIGQANQHSGPDQIRFMLRYGVTPVIRPTSPLPPIKDDCTAILGDIDGDRDPDIAINGMLAGTTPGLRIEADYCAIGGLAVTSFEGNGIRLDSANGCLIYSCHVGVNLSGTTAVHNGAANIAIWGGGGHRIGGYGRGARNVIAAGSIAPETGGPAGVRITSSSGNVIAGNNIGTNRAGNADLDHGQIGVLLDRYMVPAGAVPGPPCSHNAIGGTKTGERNAIAGVEYGVYLDSASDNTISGNWIELGFKEGHLHSLGRACVALNTLSSGNVVGGTAAGAHNVFAGAGVGVDIRGSGAQDNRIQGNYFGTNRPGTKQRSGGSSVLLSDGAGAQLIGGRSRGARNYFCGAGEAVMLFSAGSGTIVCGNTFGVLPDGPDTPVHYDVAIDVRSASCRVVNNHIAGAVNGLIVRLGPAPQTRVFGNLFRKCHQAVGIGGEGRCVLGNLGNTSTGDDGGNIFRSSNTKYIVNGTPNRIRAEGNVFGSTVQSEIDAKIVDKLDDPSYGRVDFIPLKDGVIPTGEAAVAALAVTNAAAMPTSRGGAEIAFTLSAPAEVSVTVLNLAGRPVATVVHDQAAEAGTQRVVWSGQTLNGTPAPAGTYLVRIAARDPSGGQASSLCTLELAR